MPTLQEFIPGFIVILITGAINYPISLNLFKKKKILIIIAPILLLIPSIILFIIGLLDNTFSAIGYLFYAFLFALGFIGTSISSFIIYLTKRNKV